MSAAAFVVIFGSAWFALAIICGMLAEYRHKIAAALLFEPIPRNPPIISRRRSNDG